MQIEPKCIKNILCVRNDRFGEFLLNIPALRALKETFIDTKIIMVVDPYTKELAQSIPLIDEVIPWGRGRHTLRQKFAMFSLLKKKNIDLAIMLNISKEFNIFTFLAGIPIRAGYARKWDFLLTHRTLDKKSRGLMHEVEYNLELAALLGAKTENKKLSLRVDNNIINSLARQYHIKEDDTLIALHPWTSDAIKQWPQENFKILAGRLLMLPDIKIVIIGGSNETAKSNELFSSFLKEDNIINLTGKTTLPELAALLERARLLVSCDSGPVHLACCVGTPVIAIFRNAIAGKAARRWGPWGDGHTVIESSNLLDITTEEVFNKIEEVLKNK